MSVLTYGNLLPGYQIASEAEKINLFALEGTGLAGQLVALVTGNQDPATSAGSYGSTVVGASFPNTTSLRHLVTRRVRATQAGDTKYNTLGITLQTTAETDENGLPVILQPKDRVDERSLVPSGQAVNILARGVVTLKLSQIVGTPIAGYPGVIATGGNGKIEVITPTEANLRSLATGVGGYSGIQVVGKFISNSGSAFGGYAQFKLEL